MLSGNGGASLSAQAAVACTVESSSGIGHHRQPRQGSCRHSMAGGLPGLSNGEHITLATAAKPTPCHIAELDD